MACKCSADNWWNSGYGSKKFDSKEARGWNSGYGCYVRPPEAGGFARYANAMAPDIVQPTIFNDTPWILINGSLAWGHGPHEIGRGHKPRNRSPPTPPTVKRMGPSVSNGNASSNALFSANT